MKQPPSWLDSTARTKIICGIASGMACVHSKGIIHRDLKPGNVLIDENHLPRICDFGSSRLLSTDSTPTMSGTTRAYAAPEIYDDDFEYSTKMDVYSFGVMLYEIATGKFAFRKTKNGRDRTEAQLMNYIISGNREDIESATPFTKDLIERCWAQDPDSRPSFEEICASLKKKMHMLFYDADLDEIIEFRAKFFT